MRFPWQRQSSREDGFVYEPFVLPEPVNPDFYDPDWDKWKEKSKLPDRIFIALVVVCLVGGGAFFVWKYARSLWGSNAPQAKTAPVFVFKPVPGTPKPHVFTGKGVGRTPAFTVPGGVSVLSATCKCNTINFKVTLLSATGSSISTLIDSPQSILGDTFAGSVPLGVGAGRYSLSVQAKGSWKLSIISLLPNQTVLPEKDKLFYGSGPVVWGPFAAGKAYTIRWYLPVGSATSSLNQINAVTGESTTLATSAGFSGAKLINVGSQPTSFYLYQQDTSEGWGVVIKPNG